MSRVYLSPPWVGTAERQALLDAFDSNWIAPVGPDLARFETAAATLTDTDHAVALSSGTAAIQLALTVLGIGVGDGVVIADLTFAATAFAAMHVGAVPSFVDCDPATWCIDAELLDTHLARLDRSGRTAKAIVAVDLYGQCADYDAIIEVADRWEIPVVQDAAESLGASYRGRAAGSQGRLGCLSFNGNKIITTSGGGMLLGDDEALIDRARHLATQAREPVDHYEHRDVGYNHRLSNLLAALGHAQLSRLPEKLAARTAIHDRYRDAFDGVRGIEPMPTAPYGTPNRWLSVVTVDPLEYGADRTDIIAALEENDIESRPAWKPMHLQPVFEGYPTTGGAVSSRIFEQGLCLPSGDALEPDVQDHIVRIIASCSDRVTGSVR